jgi:hypothetical protein
MIHLVDEAVFLLFGYLAAVFLLFGALSPDNSRPSTVNM